MDTYVDLFLENTPKDIVAAFQFLGEHKDLLKPHQLTFITNLANAYRRNKKLSDNQFDWLMKYHNGIYRTINRGHRIKDAIKKFTKPDKYWAGDEYDYMWYWAGDEYDYM